MVHLPKNPFVFFPSLVHMLRLGGRQLAAAVVAAASTKAAPAAAKVANAGGVAAASGPPKSGTNNSASASASASASSAASGPVDKSQFTFYESPTNWQVGHFPEEKVRKVHTTPNPFVRPPAARKAFVGDALIASLRRPLVLTVQHNNLTFAEWNAARRQLAAKGAEVRIARNAVAAARITKELPDVGPKLAALFHGPTAIVSAPKAEPATLKAIFDVLAKNPKLVVLGGRFESRVIAVSDIGPVASLPSLEALRGQLLGILQSPAASLVGLLQQAPVSVVATLETARFKLQSDADAAKGAEQQQQK